jgi:hypothetical protein
MGTLRRYDPGYDAARQLIHSGDRGPRAATPIFIPSPCIFH